MNAILYYISLPLLYLVSILPERMMYALSDLLYWVIYYGMGYRKAVVRTNLRNSFPGKSEAELLSIEKEFYKHFTDLFLETMSLIHMSEKRIRRQVRFSNFEFHNKYLMDKKSLILVTGHLGNWELIGFRYSLENIHPLYGLYSPLQNKYFDKLMMRMRTRTGPQLIAMKNTFREMIKNKDKITATAFIADQTPSPEHAYWTTFLNQTTPFFTGPAKMAKRFDLPVIYYSLRKLKRGRYDMLPEVLIENPKQHTEDEITEAFVQRLEKDIIETPAYWLWSHRRWKHHPPQ